MAKKVYVIDGNKIETIDDFYDQVKKRLVDNFPGFGCNLDAFDEILYGGFGRFRRSEKITLIWKNANKSKEALGYHKVRLFPLLNYVWKMVTGRDYVFDTLIEIIKSHKNIKLVLE